MTDLNELNRAFGRLEGKVNQIADDIADIKPHIEDWKKTKQRGIGIGIASLFSGAGVGAFLASIGKLFHP